MRDFKGKRYWLIGASEGLGAALAQNMSAAGADLVLSSRDKAKLEMLASGLSGQAQVCPVDVSDQGDVDRALSEVGDLDGVVYLAGLYWPMPAQEWNPEQATAMMEVNLTGAMRTLGPLMQNFVQKDAGHIVITGSLVGFRGLPRSIGYTASKAGLMTLAEGMYYDLQKTGVAVQLVNPGYIKTRLTDKNNFKMPFIMEPEKAADIMFRHMQSNRFAISFPRVFSLLFRLGPLLPSWLYYRLY
ncbi:MAG: SDR family NAD(P)-dependent oxidoreductase [Paracoccaceae bacterium]